MTQKQNKQIDCICDSSNGLVNLKCLMHGIDRFKPPTQEDTTGGEELLDTPKWQKYKNSKDLTERTVYWINQLSPWNMWKGIDAVNDMLATQKSSLLSRIEERVKELPYYMVKKGDLVRLSDVLQILNEEKV